MSLLRLLAAGIVACLPVTTSPAQEKIDPKLLQGVWEVTKGDATILPDGCVFDFGKDGDLSFTLKKNGKQAKFDMTYSLDGNKLTTQVKGTPGPGRVVTIKKVGEKELVWEEAGGKVIELTRKK